MWKSKVMLFEEEAEEEIRLPARCHSYLNSLAVELAKQLSGTVISKYVMNRSSSRFSQEINQHV